MQFLDQKMVWLMKQWILLCQFLIETNGNYITKFDLSPYGNEVNFSTLTNDQIETVFTRNILHCSTSCSERQECSLFDYDFSTNRCRLFIYGSLQLSLLSTSRVGIVRYSVDLYAEYGQPCQSNETLISRYLVCSSSNRYQCPKELFWNGTMCSNIYWKGGVQMNMNASLLRGWSQCYQGRYNEQLYGSILTNILNQCVRSKLFLACGLISSANLYSVGAMAPRQDVLYNCSTNVNCSLLSNHVQWYFSSDYSWGFANESVSITRTFCDVETAFPSSRLCWHTSAGYDGFRCGSILFNFPNNGSLYQRTVWHAD